MSAKIWILGLSHSGTTIFWKAFRQDQRFLCFDEPLSESIGLHFRRNNAWASLDEYVSLLQQDPHYFWNLFEPIYPYQELDSGFTPGQRRYLRALLEKADNVVIDETHLHLHLPAIKELTPDGYVIHLYRRASSFVTSHLLPSMSRRSNWIMQLKGRLGHHYRRSIFWSRYDIPAGMTRNVLIGQDPCSKFGLLLSKQGYDVDRIMNSSAVVRLLAYWHYHYHSLERNGSKFYGNRFISIPYEAFANDAGGIMQKIYRFVGMEFSEEQDYSFVHKPKPPHKRLDNRWLESARVAGFNDKEIEQLL